MVIHTVARGETLTSIGAAYGVNAGLIGELNGVGPNEVLAVGQALIIRFPKRKYTVMAGDTLGSIAAAFAVSENALYRANPGLYGNPDIAVGGSLVIDYEDAATESFLVGGYVYPFTEERLINQTLPFIDVLIPFTYGFTTDGELFAPEDEAILERVRYYGREGWMHLSTYREGGNFDVGLATALLEDTSLQDTLTENIIANMRAKGYRGLDVDFEFIGKENAAPYAAFLGRLTTRLNAEGYPVTAALAPKTRDDQPGALYEGHDYGAIGAAVNNVLLMTYEWGYTYGPPLAISPLPSVRRVLEYALENIPAEKILLGISNYGYDWTLPYNKDDPVAAPSLSPMEAVRLAASVGAEIMYDSDAQAPYFTYTKDGERHEVWYDDVRSINARLNLIGEYGIKGALYWNLTRPNTQNLSLLGAKKTVAN